MSEAGVLAVVEDFASLVRERRSEFSGLGVERPGFAAADGRQHGDHGDTADGEPVEASIGRFGPYVKHLSIYANLPDAEEVFTIGMNRAVEVLAQKAARGPGRGTAAQPLKDLGEHPDGGAVQVMPGRYGPYVKWGKVNATLPKETEPGEMTLESALPLLAEKAAKSGKGKTARPKAKEAVKPKTASKAASGAKATPRAKTTSKAKVAKGT